LRTDPEAVARNLARRGYTLDVTALRALEDKRKPWQVEVDRLRAERNASARAVGVAKGRGEDVRALIARGETLTASLAAAEAALAALQSELEQWQLGLPNLLHASVPDGRDESANLELRRWGGRQGHARHDPQSPVRQGGAGAGRAAGGFVRRARAADRARGSGAAPARDSLPHRGAVRGRCRLQQRQDLRSGGVAAVAAALSRALLVQQLRGLPGAPHAGALAQSARRQARSRAHPEWLGTRGRAHAGGGARELPEPGRFGRRAGGAAVAHGRAHGARAIASPPRHRLSIIDSPILQNK